VPKLSRADGEVGQIEDVGGNRNRGVTAIPREAACLCKVQTLPAASEVFLAVLYDVAYSYLRCVRSSK